MARSPTSSQIKVKALGLLVRLSPVPAEGSDAPEATGTVPVATKIWYCEILDPSSSTLTIVTRRAPSRPDDRHGAYVIARLLGKSLLRCILDYGPRPQ